MAKRITLTGSEAAALLAFSTHLPKTASSETLMREFARNWWYNHGDRMVNGDPIDAVPGVPESKLRDMITKYEKDYRGINDRRD